MPQLLILPLLGLLAGLILAWLYRRMPLTWLADYDETDLTQAREARDGFRFFPGILLLVLADGFLFFLGALLIESALSLAVTLYLAQPLLLIAVADWRTRIIPDQCLIALVPGALVLVLDDHLAARASVWATTGLRLLAAVLAALLLWGISWLAAKWQKREAMGMGDLKLLAACAFLVGLRQLPLLFVLSFLLAAFVALPLLVRRFLNPEADSQLAFGPYIVLATLLLLLAGPHMGQLWQSYLGLFL